jgi:ABC-type cobalamin transport system permease subunit
MSKESQGIHIEIAKVTQVGLFLGAMFPGYLWMAKGRDQRAMLQRGALVGGGLLAAAILAGLLERKEETQVVLPAPIL